MPNRLPFAQVVYILSALCSVFISTHSMAQIVFHRYDYLTTKNGLSANFITALAEDADGFLWIGTREGLNRYDGTEFLKFYTGDGLPSNDVTSICTLPNGQMAVACGSGLCVINCRRLTIQTIALPLNKNDANSNAVNFVCRSKNGDIWVNTLSGMVQYTSGFKLKKHYPFADSMIRRDAYYARNFCTAGNTGAWGSTYSKGILFADEASGKLILKNFSGLPGKKLPPQLTDPTFISHRSTGNTNVFLLGQSENTYRVVLDNNGNVLSFKPTAYRKNEAEYLTFPVTDSLWLLNPFYGHVMLYNPVTEKRSPFFNNTLALTSAPDGQGAVYKATPQGIWCGTKEGLYFFYRLPQGIQRFASIEKTIADLSFNSGVFDAVYTSVNRYLVSLVGYGLAWWDGKNELQVFSAKGPQLNKYNITLQLEKTGTNDILLQSIYGNGSFNIATKTASEKLPFQTINKFSAPPQLTCTAPDKTVWTIWKDSLYEIPFGANKAIGHAIKTDSIASLKFTCIAADANAVWMGASKHVCIKYAIGKNNFEQLTVPYPQANAGAGIYQEEIVMAKECIYIATRNGLYCWQPATKKIKLYKKENGLSSLDITTLITDVDDNVWAGTSNGLNYINATTGQVLSFYTENGLPEDDILRLRADEGRPGNLLVCSPKAICSINPRLLLQYKSIPRTIITDVLVNNERYSLNSSFSLPYNRNNISFRFTGILFGSGNQKNQYAYQLEGIDSTWKAAGTGQVANYLNLPPGRYTFNVKSASPQGFWNVADPVTFSITPPFYQTTLFYVVAAIFVIAVLLLAFRLQRKRIEKREREKRKITQEISDLKMTALRTQLNPHFIFNALNSIQFFVLDNKPVEASKYLSKFAKLFRLVLDNAGSNFIPLDKEVEWLKFYVDIEALRFNNSFTSEFILDEKIRAAEIRIPSMLIQPHIENAILHGLSHKRSGGILQVSFRLQGDGKIECLVQDNGIGREAAAQAKKNKKQLNQSKGTSLVANRMELLRSEYNYEVDYYFEDVYTDEGSAAGTIVHLTIPIHTKTKTV